MRTGELGYWWRSLGGPPPARAPLDGPAQADVAIVGAGYTGLWTAYYLKRARPSLQVAVLERERAGFGASGRNGGWVSGFFSGPARVYERRGGRAGYAALQRAMFETVDEIAAVLAEHDIDADFVKSGRLRVALDGGQAQRLRGELAHSRAGGLLEQDLRELSDGELSSRVRVAGTRAATFSPHVACVHPAKLLAGLASTGVAS
jgi:glycine/D-amino acid oxidase-like deaminating enzyme